MFDIPTDTLTAYVMFNIETGAIIQTGQCHESDISLQLLPFDTNHVAIMVASGDVLTDYVLDGKVVARPTLSLPSELAIPADGQSVAKVIFPHDTEVSFQNETVVLSDGDFEFLTDIPGSYVFHCKPPFPMMSHSLTVIANAV